MTKRIKEKRNEAVVHAYHDHANEVERVAENSEESNSVEESFPYKLHYMLTELETDGMDDIVSWQPHGRCFLVHNQKAFVEQVLPLWFRQTKFPSFQRQLNIYGFRRLTTGQDKNAYYHELFIRSKCFLSHRIQRTKIKGQGTRKPSSPETEPNFYNAPYLPPTIAHDKNVWTPPVCNSLPSEHDMNPGTRGSVSLQQLLAYSANASSFQNQQAQVAPAPLPLYNNIANLLALEEYHAQAHFEHILMEAMRQETQMLPSFLEQPIAMAADRQDGLTAEMALAFFRAEQEDLAASSNRW